jgi:MFS family permease
MQHKNSDSNIQWFMLALAALTHTFVVAMPTMCMPVLFDEISVDLDLTLVQIGAIWGIGSIAGLFTGLAGGSIGDRYGTRRTLAIACLLAGSAGALRGFANDFYTLSATFFIFGFLTPAIPINVHKVCGQWFSKKRLGLANGIVSAGMALGFAVGSMISATLLSPWLGGWNNVLFLYGAISIAISIIWVFTPDAPTESAPVTGKPKSDVLTMRGAFLQVIRLKNIWFLAIAMMGLGGCINGLLGYLPLYLRDIGWAEASADGALSAFHTISLICAIPIALISDRLRSRKTILIIGTVMIVTGTGLLSTVSGSLIWIAVLMAGMFRDGFMAVFMTTTIELEGVGPFAGTAMGTVGILSRLSGLVSPPLGNSLASIDPGLPFVFWAVLGVTALWGFSQVTEGREMVAPQPSPAS